MDRLKKHLQDHLPEMDVELPQSDLWQGIQQRIAPAQPSKGMLLPMKMMRWVAAASVLTVVGLASFLLTQKRDGASVVQMNLPVEQLPLTKEVVPQKTNETLVVVTPKTETPKPTKKVLPQPNKQKLMQNFVANQPKKKTSIKVVDSAQILRTNLANVEWKKVSNDFELILVAQKQRINRTPLLVEDPSYFDSFKLALQQLENDEKKLKKEMANGTEMNDQMLDQLIQINQQKLNLLKQLQAEINRMNERNKLKPKSENNTTSFVNI
jgi:hypothetical protein